FYSLHLQHDTRLLQGLHARKSVFHVGHIEMTFVFVTLGDQYHIDDLAFTLCNYYNIYSVQKIYINIKNQMKQQIGGLEETIRKLTRTFEKSVAPSFLAIGFVDFSPYDDTRMPKSKYIEARYWIVMIHIIAHTKYARYSHKFFIKQVAQVKCHYYGIYNHIN
ncbi:hypothetical protein ACJX0J_016177, partial [Zea mays]